MSHTITYPISNIIFLLAWKSNQNAVLERRIAARGATYGSPFLGCAPESAQEGDGEGWKKKKSWKRGGVKYRGGIFVNRMKHE